MPKIIKQICLVIICLILTSSTLAGCGNANKQTSSDGSKVISSEATAAKTQINYEGKSIKIHTNGLNPKEGDLLYQSKVDVEKRYNCKLEFVVSDDATILNDAITASLAGGEPPFEVWMDRWYSVFPEHIVKNLVLPISDYYDFNADPNWNNSYLKDSSMWGGKKYGLQVDIKAPGYAFWYNKSILQAANCKDPWDYYKEGKWDWDAFLDIVKKTTKVVSGKTVQWGYVDENPFATFIMANGGIFNDMSKVNEGKITFAFDSDVNKKAINYVLDLIKKYKVLPDRETVPFNDIGTQFLTGKAAFFPYPPAMAGNFIKFGLKANEIGYIYPPKGPDAADNIIPLNSEGYVFVFAPSIKYKKEVVTIMQDFFCTWDKNEEYCVSLSDMIDAQFSANPDIKDVYLNNKEFFLTGGKKNKLVWEFGYNIFESDFFTPLIKNEIDMASGMEKIKKMVQAELDGMMLAATQTE